MLIDTGLLALGLALLFGGGDALVRGAVSLAARLRVPPLLVGLTIVGFGTSMPEMLVSLQAAMAGLPDIAVGNAVGSNTANILLILGLTMLVAAMPTRIDGLGRDLAAMLASAVALAVVAWTGTLSAPVGIAFVAVLAGYLGYCAKTGRSTPCDTAATPCPMPVWKALALVGGGLAALVFGADCLIDGATRIARTFGLSEAVIGLTVVAVGTSLPELATSVTAAFRRQPEIAIGNVVGSNIFNILAILGVTATLAPVPIANRIATFDIPVMLVASLALAALLLAIPGRVPRLAGLPFLAAYGWYCATLLA
ncbi:calcium/sodium antiporter [Stappia sp.]|uniref:calcium/sodium antiporter n=1 Tax=Stappia sp. TaxID=1870903 RepID=UPI003D12AB10